MGKSYDEQRYHAYYPGSVTRLVNVLQKNGIASRQDVFARFDDHASAKQLAGIKGIGPVLADLLVWLRGRSDADWERITGLPVKSERVIPQTEDWS